MNQDLVIANAPRAPRTARYAYKPNRVHTMKPAPVAVAEFAGGEKIRMAFWQPIDKPWRTEPVKQWLAQIIGNERGRAGKAYADATADLDRKIAAAGAIAKDPGISLEEADTARKAVERLEKRRAKAKKEAQTAVLHAWSAKYGKVFLPATDMTSFHIEHEGRRIDPVTIERPAVKNLSGGRRTRKSAAAVSISAPRPTRPPAAAPRVPDAVSETIAKVESALGADAVDAFLEAMNEFLTRPGKIRTFKSDNFYYRIHVHNKGLEAKKAA